MVDTKEGWRPVSQAPMVVGLGSSRLLVYMPDFGVQTGSYTAMYALKGEWPWSATGFSFLADREITHWQPLPLPPGGTDDL